MNKNGKKTFFTDLRKNKLILHNLISTSKYLKSRLTLTSSRVNMSSVPVYTE